MTQPVARLCGSAFTIVLLLPVVLGLWGLNGRPIENRRLASFPAITASSLADQTFYSSLSQYMNDHLPLRDLLVRTNGVVSVNIWRDSPNPDVHIGRGDWLFTNSYRSICPEHMPASAADDIAQLGRAFARSGRELRFVLAPSKATVYPEFLGALPPPHFACGIGRIAALRDRLSAVREVGFIDLWTRLSRLKTDSSSPLYFPGDSHWTMRSATEFSRAIVESIEPGIWDQAEVVIERRIELPMDLALMIGVPRSEPVDLTATRRAGVSTDVIERADCEMGPSCVVRYQSRSADRPLIRQRTVMIRDSFGTMAMATLVPYFEDVTFLFWSKDLQEQLDRRIADADIVVYETLDHFLFERVKSGFTSMTIPPR